jgi:hypothetical protein
VSSICEEEKQCGMDGVLVDKINEKTSFIEFKYRVQIEL